MQLQPDAVVQAAKDRGEGANVVDGQADQPAVAAAIAKAKIRTERVEPELLECELDTLRRS